MAINSTQLRSDIKDHIKQSMSDYVNNVAGEQVSTPEDYADIADVFAGAIILVAQHIKDNADVTGVTAGSDTVTGGVD